jgi:hypothetical protein
VMNIEIQFKAPLDLNSVRCIHISPVHVYIYIHIFATQYRYLLRMYIDEQIYQSIDS